MDTGKQTRAKKGMETLERELHDANERLESLAATIPGVVYQRRVTPDGDIRYTYISEGARDLFGVSPEEILADPQALFDCHGPEYRATFRERLLEASRELKLWDVEAEIITRCGQRKFTHAIARPQKQDDGSVLWNGVILDATRIKEAERELLQVQKMESLGTLASGIAHEINIPVLYVAANLEFLRDSFLKLLPILKSSSADTAATAPVGNEALSVDRPLDLDFLIEEMPNALNHSLEGITRISEIIQAIKQLSYPEIKAKSAVDINQATSTAITVAQTQFKNIADLETEFDSTLPPVPCLPGEFNQVMLNLIVNAAHAIEATGREEKGSISVTTRNLGEYAEICVCDNGVGIAKKNLDKVFDPYFTTKEAGEGTGQGLAITHATITKKHGGTISVESEPGKGAIFIIRLPLNGAISSEEAA